MFHRQYECVRFWIKSGLFHPVSISLAPIDVFTEVLRQSRSLYLLHCQNSWKARL